MLAVPELGLRDHLRFGVAFEADAQLREDGVHVEDGELVERAPIDRLREHRLRQLATAIQKLRPAHARVDGQERVVHVEEGGAHGEAKLAHPRSMSS